MVQPAEAFDDVQGVTVRMPGLIEPGLVVESHRVDHKRVAFILPDRIAHPGVIWVPLDGRDP